MSANMCSKSELHFHEIENCASSFRNGVCEIITTTKKRRWMWGRDDEGGEKLMRKTLFNLISCLK